MVATDRAGLANWARIARGIARGGAPSGRPGRATSRLNVPRAPAVGRAQRERAWDGVLDECEAEGERVADEGVLIGEERAQVVAVAERQGGFVN